MPAAGRTIGRRIGQVVLASGAVLVVVPLSALALLFTLICAPPLKRLADFLANDRSP